MPRSYFPNLLLTTFAALLFGSGCIPQVGDSCETSQDCPLGAICDVTAPRGYCVIRGCDAESCPAGSVCVEFPDEAFCLEYCEADDECRQKDGYVCRGDIGAAGFCYQPQ